MSQSPKDMRQDLLRRDRLRSEEPNGAPRPLDVRKHLVGSEPFRAVDPAVYVGNRHHPTPHLVEEAGGARAHVAEALDRDPRLVSGPAQGNERVTRDEGDPTTSRLYGAR